MATTRWALMLWAASALLTGCRHHVDGCRPGWAGMQREVQAEAYGGDASELSGSPARTAAPVHAAPARP